MARAKAFHFEYALYDRKLAGYPPTHDLFRAHIPEHLRYVAYHRGDRGGSIVPDYLPAFTHEVELDELLGWRVYARESE
jgi:hypothetical protein